jgi:DNA-binding transcriptional regulator YiaG
VPSRPPPSPPDLLRAAIDATTGSARAFAGLIGSDERTVRRWLAEERAIPGPVCTLCRLVIAKPHLVRLLE